MNLSLNLPSNLPFYPIPGVMKTAVKMDVHSLDSQRSTEKSAVVNIDNIFHDPQWVMKSAVLIMKRDVDVDQ